MPGRDGILGVNAVLEVVLTDGDESVEAVAAKGGELDFARAAAVGEDFERGGRGLGTFGFDDERHLAADGRKRGGGRGLDDGDFERGGALEVRKRHGGAGEEAGQMKLRDEAKPPDGGGGAKGGEEPRLQRARRQARVPIDTLDGLGDIVLEALAEFGAVLDVGTGGKLDGGEQALAESWLSAFDELGSSRLTLRLRDEAQRDFPRGEGGSGIGGEREPRTDGVRHEPRTIEQGDHGEGRECEGDGAEKRPRFEQGGPSSAEGIERSEGGGTERKIHE